MTRTITVTGGFTGAVVLDLSDSLKQLTYATFRIALCPVGQDDPPPIDSPTWMTATATQTAGQATVSAVVDGTTTTGGYNAAVDVVKDNNHEAVWAVEPGSQRRALVVIT